MRSLLLLRHAKSSWADPSIDDFDRPLAKRGERAAALIAAHLRETDRRVDLVLCSPARRATATLAAVRPSIGDDATVVEEPSFYGATATEIVHRLRSVDDTVQSVLVVGHNPALHDLALGLVGSGPAELHAGLQVKFPTGALCVLGVPHGWSDVRWGEAELQDLVTPRALEPDPTALRSRP